jgi:rhamnogalacturonan endolyase
MYGNVWEYVTMNATLETVGKTIRNDKMRPLGGSWARPRNFMEYERVYWFSPEMRLPDLGFRLVREKPGYFLEKRKLMAASLGKGRALISWAMLKGDTEKTRYNVYRAQGLARPHDGILLNKTPILTTSYQDNDLGDGTMYSYYVTAVNEAGDETGRSEWREMKVLKKAKVHEGPFKPLYKKGSLLPIFGDLNNDGIKDCVIKLDNGMREKTPDPGDWVQLEAITSWGRSLWRRDLVSHKFCYGNVNNVPFNVWDLDGDGCDEVIARLQIGEEVFVAVINGINGHIINKTPWPEMATDVYKHSTRIVMAVAYLDGKNPFIITQTGLYENEIVTAYDKNLNQVWQFKSFAETNGSGCHYINISDLDGDGKHEVFDGTTVLNPDGSMRWSIYRHHPDFVSVRDFMPERKGLEVVFGVETNVGAGVYMVEAATGDIIWKNSHEEDEAIHHVHRTWVGDIWEESPGIEIVANRGGHRDGNMLLYTSKGEKVMEHFPANCMPLEWDGDKYTEIYKSGMIGEFNGKTIDWKWEPIPAAFKNYRVQMAADLSGDFRDELVLEVKYDDGQKAIVVISQDSPHESRFITPTESPEYRLWLARNIGGGYGKQFPRLFSRKND